LNQMLAVETPLYFLQKQPRLSYESVFLSRLYKTEAHNIMYEI
jgi:hypothetical protein